MVENRLEALNALAIADATTLSTDLSIAPAVELELSITSGLVLLGVLLIGAGCGPPS